ncbi:response regulator [Lacimicrobium sp. SS2-24]|uniref:response regulator n=1 Tax=Lacimicrobium sp. SS2-24 TaxID=2005569 RepID=UPI000B4AA59C|nr:response regulator [Lacimicrobium sp. SS2-24]
MNIVIIDDEPLITEVLTVFMENKGANVLTFNRAEEGLAHIKTHHKDINAVVTDYRMPGTVDGGDIYRYIRANHTHIICFIISGFIDGNPNGINPEHIIGKPLDFNDLVERIWASCTE